MSPALPLPALHLVEKFIQEPSSGRYLRLACVNRLFRAVFLSDAVWRKFDVYNVGSDIAAHCTRIWNQSPPLRRSHLGEYIEMAWSLNSEVDLYTQLDGLCESVRMDIHQTGSIDDRVWRTWLDWCCQGYYRSGEALISHLPDSLYNDREFYRKLCHMGLIKQLQNEYWDDYQSVLGVVSHNGNALANAPEWMLADQTVVMAAVTNWGLALLHASNDLKDNKEIVLAAVASCGFALDYASTRLKADHDIILAAAAETPEALRFCVYEDDHDWLLTLAARYGRIVWETPLARQDRDIVLTAVKNYPLAITKAEKFYDDFEILMEAVKQFPMVLYFLPERVRDHEQVMVAAIKKDPLALEYFESYDVPRDLVLDAVTRGGGIEYTRFCNDREIVLAAVRHWGYSIRFAEVTDKQIALEAVTKNGGALLYAGEFMSDRDVVLAAVAQDGLAVEYAGPFKKDKDVILTAVKSNLQALQHVDKETLKDPELMISVGIILGLLPETPDPISDQV